MSIFDVSVDDKQLETSIQNSAEWGLNKGVLKNFYLGEDRGSWQPLNIEVEVNGRTFKGMLFIGGQYFDETAQIQLIATVKHLLKATGVTDIAISNKVAQMGLKEFHISGIEGLLSLKPDGEFPVDVFLHWQKKISDREDKNGNLIKQTYLELPQDMKTGYWIIPQTTDNWEKVITEDGALRYKNSKGVLHPFERSSYFMTTVRANQQFRDEKKQIPAAVTTKAEEDSWGLD